MDYSVLAGYDLVRDGIRDLAGATVNAYLLFVGAERLRRAAVPVPVVSIPDPEHQMFALLEKEDADAAQSRYNALIRQLVSLSAQRNAAAAAMPALP